MEKMLAGYEEECKRQDDKNKKLPTKNWGGMMSTETLTPLQERILSIVGETVCSGHPFSVESEVEIPNSFQAEVLCMLSAEGILYSEPLINPSITSFSSGDDVNDNHPIMVLSSTDINVQRENNNERENKSIESENCNPSTVEAVETENAAIVEINNSKGKKRKHNYNSYELTETVKATERLTKF